MRFFWTVPGLCLLVSACSAPQVEDGGAQSLARFVGQPGVGVAAIETPGPTRLLPPGARRTATDPDRLTIVSASDGTVAALYCG